MSDSPNKIPQTEPHQSATFDQLTNSQIRRAAATGIYDIRGGGAKRKLPHFDDLLFFRTRNNIINDFKLDKSNATARRLKKYFINQEITIIEDDKNGHKIYIEY